MAKALTTDHLDAMEGRLGQLINDGFQREREETNKQFTEVRKEMNERFDAQDKTLVVIEDHLEKIDLQLEQIKPAQERISELQTRVETLEKSFEKFKMRHA